MGKTYLAFNGPKQTTAAPASVTTSAAIKTLQQIAPPSSLDLTVIEWGISFDGTNPTNTPIKVELIETDVAATVTAYASGDITAYSRANDIASQVTLGTTASGYTATAEGTITAVRTLDLQLLPNTNPFWHQFPLGYNPQCRASKFLRVRVTAAVAVNAYTYVIWEE